MSLFFADNLFFLRSFCNLLTKPLNCPSKVRTLLKISSPSLSILTVTQPKASVIVVATVALIAPPAIVPTAGTNFKTFYEAASQTNDY